jgi:hypothetical protein
VPFYCINIEHNMIETETIDFTMSAFSAGGRGEGGLGEGGEGRGGGSGPLVPTDNVSYVTRNCNDIIFVRHSVIVEHCLNIVNIMNANFAE